MLGLFLANSSTEPSRQHYLCSTTPERLVFALHVTIPPSWFDPAETPAQITPFAILYALHDAVVRPLPGERMAPALAASWTESPDGLTYEFKLRPGLRFHNGDPCTAEDVQYSFTRYKGTGAKELQAKVERIEVVDPLTVRFHLREPWRSCTCALRVMQMDLSGAGRVV